ncbi:hypothetical protein [Streptomyces sp. FH025]|uniref:Rv1733c family protein n=1 Tax=Streptomyces sp. FH025 TaxID=2815937 RepID=UPI001A9D2B61|nr:hypothetical protein [Streptomyces sp. FH025]MBO1417718.1 hypothetical protein [Streptomyces sp. FH025]
MSAAAATHRPQGSRAALRQHVRRALGRDRNPLCRSLDRAYSRLMTGLALAVLATFVVAVVAALLVYRAETHTASQVARHRHAVTAVTTGPAVSDGPRTGGTTGHAPARWTYPAGPGSGSIPVQPGTLAGTAVRVGLDDAGLPAIGPKGPEQILSDTTLAGLVTVSVLGFGTEGVFALRRQVLEQRAEAAWERAWEQVEPGWSGRR